MLLLFSKAVASYITTKKCYENQKGESDIQMIHVGLIAFFDAFFPEGLGASFTFYLTIF